MKLSERTIKEYHYYYRKLMSELISCDCKESEIDNEIIEYFVVNYNNNVFRAFLKDYLDWKNLPLKIPKIRGAKQRKKKLYISPNKITKLKNYFLQEFGMDYTLMLLLSYYCALRRSEIVNIRADDFDWSAWLEENQPLVLTLSADYTKRKKDRKILVPDFLANSIFDWMSSHLEDIDARETLFGVSITKWRKAFRKAVLETNNDGFTLHGLRRSRASYWNKQGMDILKIKTLLGHADISTTQLYIDEDEEGALDELSKIQ